MVLCDFSFATDTQALGANDFYFKQCGAIGYMAPESLSKKSLGGEGISLDSSCDMYSVGVIFYILLTGQIPWKNKNQSVFEQNLEGKICFELLEEKFRDLGKGEILDAVKGMLEKDPTKRLTAEQILKSRVFIDQLYTESTLQLSSEFGLPPVDLIDPRNPKINNSKPKPATFSKKNSIVLSKSSGGGSGGKQNESENTSSNKFKKTTISSKHPGLKPITL